MQLIPRSFTIKTARCLLSCPSEKDIPHIFSATRFPGFNDGMRWEPPASMDELYKPLQNNLLAWDAGNAYAFAISTLSSETFLGRIAIRQYDELADIWNIGFWTHPSHYNQGYMTESAQAILEFGFIQLGATSIEAGHAVWNKSSQRVLEKIGMKFVKYNKQGFQKRGKWVEDNLMRITKEEWENHLSIGQESTT
jgi:[ribosomal protein S5]-alanine N-acetyltransferase